MSLSAKQIVASGAFDNIRSSDLRFLEKAAELGDLTVLLWDDQAIEHFTGAPPKFSLAERRYLLNAIRYVCHIVPVDNVAFDSLPEIDGFRPDIWADLETSSNGKREKFCREKGVLYHVLKGKELTGFPELPSPPPASGRKKVVATGCYDWLHAGHVRFCEEVSAYGDLYIIVGHDQNIRLLKGAGHLCDKTGSLAGVPYDGRLTLADGQGQWWDGYDPQQLYCRKHGIKENPDEPYVRNFYDRVRDLIDQHDPDLLYFDNTGLPLGWAGMNVGAYFYNHNLKTRGGKMEAVLNIKGVPEEQAKGVVADYERGVTKRIMPYAWQSETCIGDWHYNRARFLKHNYMKPGQVIHWMVDAVSKNATFILNVPGRPDGTIDADEQAILDAIGDWMTINGEAIYATRPWKVYGEGTHNAKAGSFAGNSTRALDAHDIRFTRNKRGDVVYAIVLGWPIGDIEINNLGLASPSQPGKVQQVELLGCVDSLKWTQSNESLAVQKPSLKPCDFAYAFKIGLG